eukprot:TRINITY_DN33120_c0_g1_i1.p1 TRINITY_DN33120_c0_g1~~TRINITY_DN33120_c0_g1_i1.p1  ORF type:complete len:756 (+),score=136.18 TRINITY_DN33120_c0_g1_i1:186-2453(+)
MALTVTRELNSGDFVEVHGLHSEVGLALNGAIGVVAGLDTTSARYQVELKGHGLRAFKAENLRPARSEDSPGAVKLGSRSDTICFEQKRFKCDGAVVSQTLVTGPPSASDCYSFFPDRGFQTVLALHRHKPPWTRPSILGKLSELPQETLWAIVKPLEPSAGFLVLSAVADPSCGTSTALQGSDQGFDNFEISVSGSKRAAEGKTKGALLLHVLEVPAGTPVASATAWSACLLQRQLSSLGGTVQLRTAKKCPTALRRWGWCCWDAYGVQVKQDHLLEVARKFQPPWLVLDDGWQEQVSSERWREWLHTPQTGSLAHGQFGDLQALSQKLQPSMLLVWHTLHGYWGGVAANRGYITQTARPCWPEGLRAVCPGEIDVWDGGFNVIKGKAEIARYYSDFYASLASVGVKGVKCDGQFLPEILVSSEDAVAYADAQQQASFKAFGDDSPVLHCMALTLQRLHGSGRAAVTRVSDDHAYPGVEEDAATVARHIWHCAANALWLREYLFCDWDMFRTSEWHASIHAVARAVSGGPVYVSDLADRLSIDVIKPLLLPEDKAQIVPCTGCGAVIGRHAFVDPTSSGEAWFTVNTTEVGWIAAAFGLTDVGSNLLRSTLFPADLLGDAAGAGKSWACLQVDLQHMGHAGLFTDSGWDVAIHYMNFAVLAVVPVLYLRHANRSIALFGLHGVWNPTGTFEQKPVMHQDSVKINMRCKGDLLVWVDGGCVVGLPGLHQASTASAGLLRIPVPAGGSVLEVEDFY